MLCLDVQVLGLKVFWIMWLLGVQGFAQCICDCVASGCPGRSVQVMLSALGSGCPGSGAYDIWRYLVYG